MFKLINEISKGKNLTKYAYTISGIQFLYMLIITGGFFLIFTPEGLEGLPEPFGIIYVILYLPTAIIYLTLGSAIYFSSFKNKLKVRCVFYPLFFIILFCTFFYTFFPEPMLYVFVTPLLLLLSPMIPIAFIHGLILDIIDKTHKR